MNLFLLAVAAYQANALPTVSGTILNAATKEPVRKAEVRLEGQRGAGPLLALTGADGRFEFKSVAAGAYVVHARRNGFVDGGRRADNRPSARVEVSNQDIGGIQIALMPQAVLAGKVLDEDGEPLQGVTVQALAMRGVRGQRRLIPVSGENSDDRGEFRLSNLNPGSYLLQVSPSRWGGAPVGTSNADPVLGYVPMFYPGVYDPGQAEKVRVSAGAEVSGLLMRLARTRVFTVRGRVLDSTGQVPKQYMLQAVSRELPSFGPRAEQFVRMPDGSFELRNVAPGNYSLVVRTSGAVRGGGISHCEPVTVGGQDIDNLTLRLSPPVTVTGRVSLASPLPDFDFKHLQIGLNDPILFFGGGGNAIVQPDGNFRIEQAAPGSYRLAISVPSDAVYVESIRVGDREITGREIEISPGGAPSVEIVLNHGGGVVEASAVHGDKPLAGATVVLLPRDRALWETSRLRVAKTNSAGTTAFANVAPGEYTAFAFDEFEDGIWEDEDQFRKFESKGKRLSITRSRTESVSLPAISLEP